jgi:hypothetical protein
MRKILCALASGAATLCVAVPAAAQINAPVPTDNYITFMGNDWAWASPCPPSGGFGGTTCGDGSLLDLTYQGTQGWRLPTAAELATGPTVADFNTPGGFKCASAWFTSSYTWCDYGDAAGGAVFGTPGGNVWYAETWVIRAGAVPEAASWAMMVGGFGLIGGAMRNRRRAMVSFA